MGKPKIPYATQQAGWLPYTPPPLLLLKCEHVTPCLTSFPGSWPLWQSVVQHFWQGMIKQQCLELLLEEDLMFMQKGSLTVTKQAEITLASFHHTEAELQDELKYRALKHLLSAMSLWLDSGHKKMTALKCHIHRFHIHICEEETLRSTSRQLAFITTHLQRENIFW